MYIYMLYVCYIYNLVGVVLRPPEEPNLLRGEEHQPDSPVCVCVRERERDQI